MRVLGKFDLQNSILFDDFQTLLSKYIVMDGVENTNNKIECDSL